MNISSSAITPGLSMPIRFTCEGENVSPPLHWSDVPSEAKTLALIVDDPDAPNGTFTHWVVFNIPVEMNSLDQNFSKLDLDHNVAIQGKNDRGKIGYFGPCPPKGETHRYHFRLYALNNRLDLAPGTTRDQVTTAMEGHILEEVDLIVPYSAA
jgi:Raf kinase inhibitor-like YbhB/YbcL family protein